MSINILVFAMDWKNAKNDTEENLYFRFDYAVIFK